MKRFLYIFIVVVLLFTVFDSILGIIYNNRLSKIESDKYKEYFILMKAESPDVLILGASNASHFFNSNILRDSLGLSVYNAAQDGQGILYNKVVFDAVLKREKPKIVVLGLYYALLNGSFDDSVLQYSYLYGKSQEMTSAIEEVIQPWEKVKYLSSAYCFNSNFMWILSINGDDKAPDINAGYVPLPKGDGIITLQRIPIKFEWDKRSKNALIHILETCKQNDIQCIACLTPQYRVNLNMYFNEEIKKYAEQYGALYIDYINDEFFNKHPELFKDEMHLCAKGADIFTSDFVGRIKKQR